MLKTQYVGAGQISQLQLANDAVGSQQLAGTALAYSYQMKDAVVSGPKIGVLIQYGSITNITRTGRYRNFTIPFGAAPHVVVSSGTVQRGTLVALKKAPAVGSFRAGLTGAGTVNGWFIAIGSW